MEKIKRLKNTFRRENVDGYIISKNDQFSEIQISTHYFKNNNFLWQTLEEKMLNKVVHKKLYEKN